MYCYNIGQLFWDILNNVFGRGLSQHKNMCGVKMLLAHKFFEMFKIFQGTVIDKDYYIFVFKRKQ